jgi:hypothetical protein
MVHRSGEAVGKLVMVKNRTAAGGPPDDRHPIPSAAAEIEPTGGVLMITE